MPFNELQGAPDGESSEAIRRRVIAARAIQQERYKESAGIYCNAQMNSRMIARWASPEPEAMKILEQTMTRFDMSARAYDRILKVARTIADLDAAASASAAPFDPASAVDSPITALHMREAVSYRNLDRATWGLKL